MINLEPIVVVFFFTDISAWSQNSILYDAKWTLSERHHSPPAYKCKYQTHTSTLSVVRCKNQITEEAIRWVTQNFIKYQDEKKQQHIITPLLQVEWCGGPHEL